MRAQRTKKLFKLNKNIVKILLMQISHVKTDEEILYDIT